MQELTFQLEDFDGPLDMLLHLISKNKMDLHNIPILALIDQYMEIIDTVQQQKWDVASEFIDMAARLVQMKSAILLPHNEETAERLAQELTGQLIEYDLCKKVAARLGQMGNGVYVAVRQPMQPPRKSPYTIRHEASLLRDMWNSMMGRSAHRRPSEERFEPLVTAPFVSVSSRVLHVMKSVLGGRVKRFRQLFSSAMDRSTTVATFLAVLELVRHGRLTIDENEALYINRNKIQGKPEQEVEEWN